MIDCRSNDGPSVARGDAAFQNLELCLARPLHGQVRSHEN
jgi:hypothetical protein